MRPTYFDLAVLDLEQSRRFFESVLGWRFERFEMPYDYYRIRTGPNDEPGIDGGIGSAKDALLSGGKPMSLLTVPVNDLDQMLQAVTANGGRILEPRIAVPGVGWYATCAEPGGLMFGLIQADAQAGSGR